jgi:hypothetical protein
MKARYDPKQIKEQFDELKRYLPAVTWSGWFPMLRRVELIKEHSGMVTADVDDLTAQEIDDKWASLMEDPHFWRVFLSPSEGGIKIVVPMARLNEQWPIREGMSQPEYAVVANQFQYATFFALRRYMFEKHGLQIDGSCKDSSRLCYLPYDDKAYSNPWAEPLEVPWSQDVEQQIEEERAREREEKAVQKRDQGKAKTKAPSSKTESAADPATTPKPGSSQAKANGSAEEGGPFHQLSDQEQEKLVDACLDALDPDAVPPAFGAADDAGDRHRWDISIGMAIKSWDSGDRGLEKYLAWGQGSDHKSDEEREKSWGSFDEDGKVTVGTLLKFGREAGVKMPWAGQRPDDRDREKEKTATIQEMLADHELIDVAKADELAVRGLMEFAELASDPDAVILGNRWLLRKSAGCLFAPSGVGKSTTAAQASVLWSLGKPAFDIKPAKPLRIVIFQAEDDDLDIREIVAGIKKLYELSAEECAQVNENVKIVRTRKSGFDFFQKAVLPAIKAFKPDLIVINPVMAYTDCDMLKQDEAASFFRRILGEILESFNIACILIHHTPKPTNTDLTKLNRYQEQYLAFGSSDLINWVRAALMIWPTDVEGVFEFRASKRGEKIGWKAPKPGPDGLDEDDDVGEAILVPVFTRLFKHWTGSVQIAGEEVEVTAWVEPGPDDEMKVAEARKKRRGGVEKKFGPYEVIKHMPAHQAVTLKEIVDRVASAFRTRGQKPPSQRTIQRALKEAAGEVKASGQLMELVEHEGNKYTRLEGG